MLIHKAHYRKDEFIRADPFSTVQRGNSIILNLVQICRLHQEFILTDNPRRVPLQTVLIHSKVHCSPSSGYLRVQCRNRGDVLVFHRQHGTASRLVD